MSAAVDGTLANWAGNYRYSTDRLHRATSLDDVQAFVRQHDRFKVLGTRHCFNGIADSTRSLLSLRDMARVVVAGSGRAHGDRRSRHELRPVVPRTRSTGLRAAQPRVAAAHLDRRSVRDGTHGSGVKNGNLATAVSALEIVTARRRRADAVAREGRQHVSRAASSISARSAWSPRSRSTSNRPSRCARTST